MDNHWFLSQLNDRLNTGRNVLGGVTGDLGSGKTYWCLKIAETLDPDFSTDNVVFSAKAFLKRAMELKRRQWIVYDEPGVSLSNRTFMSDMNRITGYFLQSSRYRQINALFALPSLFLMDIAARTILLFQALMNGRGTATIYRIQRNQFGQNPPYWTHRVGIVQTAKPSPATTDSYEKLRRDWHEKHFKQPADSPVRVENPVNLVDHIRANRADYLDPVKGILSTKRIIGKHQIGLSAAYRIKAILDEEMPLTKKT